MTSKRLGAQKVELLRGLIRDGVPFGEIAKVFDVGVSAVSYHAVQMGLDARSRRDAAAAGARVRPPQPTGALAYVTASYPPIDGTQPCTQDPDAFDQDTHGVTSNSDRTWLEQTCAACPFRRPCLAYAIAYAVDGWWGGTSRAQRNAIRKKHQILARPLTRRGLIPEQEAS